MGAPPLFAPAKGTAVATTRRPRGKALPVLALLAALVLGALVLLGEGDTRAFRGYKKRPNNGKMKKSRTWRKKIEDPVVGEGSERTFFIHQQRREKMEVLLVKDVYKKGVAGDIVSVKRGFYRNYLLPAGFAVRKNASQAELFLAQREEQKEEAKQASAAALAQKKQIEAIGLLTFKKRVIEDTDGKIYGSLTPTNVGELVTVKSGVPVRITSIEVPKIEELGTYSVKINLTPEVQAVLQVEVVPEDSEEE